MITCYKMEKQISGKTGWDRLTNPISNKVAEKNNNHIREKIDVMRKNMIGQFGQNLKEFKKHTLTGISNRISSDYEKMLILSAEEIAQKLSISAERAESLANKKIIFAYNGWGCPDYSSNQWYLTLDGVLVDMEKNTEPYEFNVKIPPALDWMLKKERAIDDKVKFCIAFEFLFYYEKHPEIFAQENPILYKKIREENAKLQKENEKLREELTYKGAVANCKIEQYEQKKLIKNQNIDLMKTKYCGDFTNKLQKQVKELCEKEVQLTRKINKYKMLNRKLKRLLINSENKQKNIKINRENTDDPVSQNTEKEAKINTNVRNNPKKNEQENNKKKK